MFSLRFCDLYAYLPFILEGVLVTLKYTLISLSCGLPIGVMLGFFKVSNNIFIKAFANFYTSIFRGTPLLVQLGLIYYGTQPITGYKISAFEASVLTFSLNSGAYVSEIIRTGIESIDKGQWDAGFVLGLSYKKILIKIISPQAIKNILPALVNEVVDLLKESALISTIGEMDLYRRAHIIAAEKFMYFEPMVIVALIYFVMVMIISCFAKILEKKLSYAVY